MQNNVKIIPVNSSVVDWLKVINLAKIFIQIISVMLFVSLLQSILTAEDYRGPNQIVADAGSNKILLSTMLESWEPQFSLYLEQVKTGKLTVAEARVMLQQAWDSSLDAAIREEIFIQEADRELDNMIRKQVADALAGSSRQNQSATPRDLENEAKRQLEKAKDKYVRDNVNRSIRAAGGMRSLERSLQSRGVTMADWRLRLERRARANIYLDLLISPLIRKEPRPIDFRRYYEQHPKEFIEPDLIAFRHILCAWTRYPDEDAAKNAALDILDLILDKKISFADAARTYSQDSESKERGGLETSTLSADPERESWLTLLRNTAEQMSLADPPKPVLTDAGAHLLILESKTPGKTLTFAEAQPTIRRRLANQAFEEAVDNHFQSLKGQVFIKIRSPQFPERYQEQLNQARGSSLK